MGGRHLLPIMLLAGCDVVFGFDTVYDCPLDDDDCDKILDHVDPCPADSGDKTDSDGDGVGDRCDPDLDVAADSLLEFESFVTKDARWLDRTPAAWDVRDSALVLDS